MNEQKICLLLLLLWILQLCEVSSSSSVRGKEPYNVYYLLHNGTDSFSCGRTAETACQTLEQVLTLFYNGTSQLVEHGLEIITSKSPLINQQTMVTFPEFSGSVLRINSFVKDSDSCLTPTVMVENVHFMKSKWEILDLNVFMRNSNTTLLELLVSQDSLNSFGPCLVSVRITDCLLGNWILENLRNVQVKNSCLKLKPGMSRSKTPITTLNSALVLTNVTVDSVTFLENHHAFSIDSSSDVVISKSTFSNNKVVKGLINVAQSSKLQMNQCTFSQNVASCYGGAVFLSSASSAEIRNTVFEQNAACDGGAIAVQEQSSLTVIEVSFVMNKAKFGGAVSNDGNETVFVAEHCIFESNHAESGGAIYGRNSIQWDISNCTFVNNSAGPNLGMLGICDACNEKSEILDEPTMLASFVNVKMVLLPELQSNETQLRAKREPEKSDSKDTNFQGGAIFCVTQCNVTISNSTFVSNQANLYGATIYARASIFFVSYCNFRNNTVGMSGSCIFMWEKSSLTVTGSSFVGNSAGNYGAINVGTNSQANIIDSIFAQNMAKYGTALYVSDHNEVTIQSCIFQFNTGERATLLIIYNTVVTIENCTFQSNRAVHGGSVAMSHTNVSLEVINSTFIENTSGLGPAIVVGMNSSIAVTSARFLQNEAILFSTIGVSNFSTLQMRDVVFYNNTARTDSGTVYGDFSTISCDGCVFSNNQGGAIRVKTNMTIFLANSQLADNTVIGSPGGALYASDFSSLTITNVTFTGNKAPRGGALDAARFCTVNISDSTFDGNTATASSGGAIWVMSNSDIFLWNTSLTNNEASQSDAGALGAYGNCTVAVSECYMANNLAKSLGGSMLIQESNITIVNSGFENNTVATYYGGVLFSALSNIKIVNSTFSNNSADVHGGAIYAQGSNMSISNSYFQRNTVRSIGAAIMASFKSRVTLYHTHMADNNASFGTLAGFSGSTVELRHCSIRNSHAMVEAGAVYIEDKSVFVGVNSTFENNTAKLEGGGCISVKSHSETFLDNCTVTECNGIKGGAIKNIDSELRLSKVKFYNNSAREGKDIAYHTFEVGNPKLYTYKSTFRHDFILPSDSENFEDEALARNVIFTNTDILMEETPYSSVNQQVCLHKCACYHLVLDKANVLDCHERNLTDLPESVVDSTTQLILSRNNLGDINEVKPYMDDINRLDMNSCQITGFSDNAMGALIWNKTYLNFMDNHLKYLPRQVSETSNKTELWLSNNPYECNCDMMWMRNWLVKATNVMDKENVTCATGKMKGSPIYQLDKELMGCVFPLWAIVTISAFAILIIVAIVALHRYWEKLKFYAFVHFNVLTKDDRPENLDEMDFDGYVTYSHLDRRFVKAEVIDFLEDECGFKLCIHERDFLGGATIPDNITAAINHSRRMIMVISRNYIHSGWCMAEFHIAHEQVVNGRKNFLIPLLLEDILMEELDNDLKMYIETHTYIDCKNLALMKKRLRYTMPHVALFKHRPEEIAEEQRLLTHVDIVAKRITEREQERRRAAPQPEGAWGGDIDGAWGGDVMGPLGGDLETSSSGTETETDEDDDYAQGNL